MLHLLPIRRILGVSILLIGMTVLLSVYAGVLGDNGAVPDVLLIARWSAIVAAFIILLLLAAWRWIPPLQRAIFPYLGGQWSGVVEFSYQGRLDQRPITLEVRHTLLGLKLILDSSESTSRTLVVHAEMDRGIERYRLYYVYQNERKEGVPNAGQTYRGLAVIRVQFEPDIRLIGSYFTETQRQGQIRLYLQTPNSWWNLFR
jgi:hypothetical protein